MKMIRYSIAIILSIILHVIFFILEDVNNKNTMNQKKDNKMEVILNKTDSVKLKGNKLFNHDNNKINKKPKLISIEEDIKKIENFNNVDNSKHTESTNKNSSSFKKARIFFDKPKYPYISRIMGEEGKVLVEVKIGRKDNILSISVVKSSGYKRLDKIVVKQLRNAKVKSATRNGKKIVTERKIGPFKFKLKN